MNIVCFLTIDNPHKILLDFCKTLVNNYKIYICVDKYYPKIVDSYLLKNINIINYKKGVCEREGCLRGCS